MHDFVPFLIWGFLGAVGWFAACMSLNVAARRAWAANKLSGSPSSIWDDPTAVLIFPLCLLVGPFALLVAAVHVIGARHVPD